MATVREKLLPVVARLRGVADARMGLRRFAVYVRRVTPSDARGGIGATYTTVDTPLAEKPRIRQASMRDVVASAGRISIADFLMDRVTPRNAANTVGTPVASLDLSPNAAGQKVLLVLVGPGMPAYSAGPPPSGGGEYEIATSDFTGNFGFSFVLTPRTGHR